MAAILLTGNATLDIVQTVDHFPREDEEMRAAGRRMVRGGNAANTACVLAGLGHAPRFFGLFADDAFGEQIRDDLRARGVNINGCPVVEGDSPLSCILVNARNGSRTIVHHRNLPEPACGDFRRLPLETFDWFHFEGRNVEQTRCMMETVRERRVDQPVSLEMEKDREGFDALLPLADVIVASRALVTARGFSDPAAFAAALRPQIPQGILVVTWGEAGAWGFAPRGEPVHVPAFPPPRVVDTVGAGDTFIAGLIDALVSGRTLPAAIEAASRLAGRKVGQWGFDGLRL